jgi:hypothetical protein
MSGSRMGEKTGVWVVIISDGVLGRSDHCEILHLQESSVEGLNFN